MKYLIAVIGLFLIVNCAGKESNDMASWIGTYIYDEEPVLAIADYSMVMNWNLKVYDESKEVRAFLEVNGQQTSFKLKAKLFLRNQNVSVIYDDTLEGVVQPLAKGDTLFVLSMQDKNLITKWKALKPRLLENAPKQCNCFRLTKSDSH